MHTKKDALWAPFFVLTDNFDVYPEDDPFFCMNECMMASRSSSTVTFVGNLIYSGIAYT